MTIVNCIKEHSEVLYKKMLRRLFLSNTTTLIIE